jgi:hypothetical protein
MAAPPRVSVDVAGAPHRRLNLLSGRWLLCSPHRALRPWQGQVRPFPVCTRTGGRVTCVCLCVCVCVCVCVGGWRRWRRWRGRCVRRTTPRATCALAMHVRVAHGTTPPTTARTSSPTTFRPCWSGRTGRRRRRRSSWRACCVRAPPMAPPVSCAFRRGTTSLWPRCPPPRCGPSSMRCAHSRSSCPAPTPSCRSLKTKVGVSLCVSVCV